MSAMLVEIGRGNTRRFTPAGQACYAPVLLIVPRDEVHDQHVVATVLDVNDSLASPTSPTGVDNLDFCGVF
jgi:hypothetical protein